MIDDHGVAGEVEIAGEHDAAAVRCTTGVPAGLRKSAPPCGWRRSPLKMLRVPNAPFTWPGTGRSKPSLDSRLGVDCVHRRLSAAASSVIRASIGPADSQNASSTMSVLVAKTRGLIVIVVVAVTACPPETPSNDTTYGPAFVSRSIRAVPAISGCRDGRPRHRDRMHAREALRTARACSP